MTKEALSTEEKILRAGKRLIKNGWCQFAWARDLQGNSIDWDSPLAVEFCPRAAVQRAARELNFPPYKALIILEKSLKKLTGKSAVCDWCDQQGRTKKDILGLFTEAEKLAKEGWSKKPIPGEQTFGPRI